MIEEKNYIIISSLIDQSEILMLQVIELLSDLQSTVLATLAVSMSIDGAIVWSDS